MHDIAKLLRERGDPLSNAAAELLGRLPCDRLGRRIAPGATVHAELDGELVVCRVADVDRYTITLGPDLELEPMGEWVVSGFESQDVCLIGPTEADIGQVASPPEKNASVKPGA